MMNLAVGASRSLIPPFSRPTRYSRISISPVTPIQSYGPAQSPRTIGTPETTAQAHPQLFTRTLISKAVEDHEVEVVIGKLERVEVEGARVGRVVLEGGRVVDGMDMKGAVNEIGGTKRVETVDYRSSAGQGQEERKVEVIHELHHSEGSKSNTSGGVLAGAAAAVASTLESAKDALSKE